MGGLPALAVLHELQERLSEDEEVRRTAREAIAAIRERASGSLPGQLSLADDDRSGQVSLASGDAGRVSIAPDADGPE